MKPKPKTRLSAFGSADRSQQSFLVEIDLDDVRQIRPDWSEEQAKAFLLANRGQIASAMLTHGLKVIIELARKEFR